ncbi:MAG: RraA family protein [Methanobrevibacter sp.]|jgi:3-hexulose-6-phosphate synthase|nr:RraA family protein [Candidatus Methanovirga aequatorialis]
MKNEKLTPKDLLKRVSKKKTNQNENFPYEDYFKCLSIEDLYDEKESGSYYYNLKLLLDSTSTCEISDALFSLTNSNGVLRGLKNINGLKAYGRIVTVKTSYNDWGTSVLAIDEAKEGEALLIKTYPEDGSHKRHLAKRRPSAVWGELTSIAAKNKKIAGTFVWGHVRDIDDLNKLNFPVFALDICPNAGSALGHGTVNDSMILGHCHVNPGDFIFGDGSGVVLIPKELFETVMKKVVDIRVSERNISTSLKKGKSFSELVRLKW